MKNLVRIHTGIIGLDELVQGGFEKGSVILVSGVVGTGKSIFASQFLCRSDEKCVFISLEESEEDVRRSMNCFKWPVESLEREDKLVIKYCNPSNPKNVLETVRKAVTDNKVKRIVIDSITAFSLNFESKHDLWVSLFELVSLLKNSKCTSLLTSKVQDESQYSYTGIEEYLVDSVVLLRYANMGMDFNRSLFIQKMRRTRHSEEIMPLKITEKGLEIVTND